MIGRTLSLAARALPGLLPVAAHALAVPGPEGLEGNPQTPPELHLDPVNDPTLPVLAAAAVATLLVAWVVASVRRRQLAGRARSAVQSGRLPAVHSRQDARFERLLRLGNARLDAGQVDPAIASYARATLHLLDRGETVRLSTPLGRMVEALQGPDVELHSGSEAEALLRQALARLPDSYRPRAQVILRLASR